jgi:hypothetical protein
MTHAKADKASHAAGQRTIIHTIHSALVTSRGVGEGHLGDKDAAGHPGSLNACVIYCIAISCVPVYVAHVSDRYVLAVNADKKIPAPHLAILTPGVAVKVSGGKSLSRSSRGVRRI